MKKIITSALVIALTIGAASAQTTTDHPSREIRKERNMAFDQLSLTADQKAKLQSVRAEFKKQMTDLKSNSQLTADEQKSRRKELHQQYKAQMEAILTPAQKEQLAKSRAEWKAKNKDGKGQSGSNAQAWKQHKNGKDFARSAAIQKELDLSADQQAKLAQIKDGFKGKVQSIRTDQALTQDQKKEKMHELRKEQQEQMKTVLTPDQFKKLQSLRKEHSNRNTK